MHVTDRQTRYGDSMSLAAARAAFFADAGLGDDGGYGAAWVRVETKPFPVYFPNTSCRVAAAKLHDLHHVATDYGTDWPGEAEIAAWEIAGGCGTHGWAWVLNLGAFLVGLLRAPRRLFRAFVRGRRARNLYHDGFADARLTEVTVGMLREQLRIDASTPTAGRRDVIAFVVWSAIAVLWHLAWAAVGVGAVLAVWLGARA
jgi:hypothetical protein